MSATVHKLTDSEIKKVLASITVPSEQKLPPGSLYRAKINAHTVTIYNSGKLMVQGSDSDILAENLLKKAGLQPSGNSVSTLDKKLLTSNQKSLTKSNHYDQFNCVGSDEAGSGDYFGPMTVAASYVSKKNAEILKTLGVMDSKNLKDDKIVQLAEQIITFIPHSLLVLDNPKYNERKRMGWSQVKMKAVLHNQAITNVLNKIGDEPLDYIIIDQFAVQGVYENYALTKIPKRDITKFETKGESKSIAIAASSIIARYAFVKWMDHIEHETGLAIYKGAGAKVDLQAAKIVQKKSVDYLDSITKKDFKNREKALQLLERKK